MCNNKTKGQIIILLFVLDCFIKTYYNKIGRNDSLMKEEKKEQVLETMSNIYNKVETKIDAKSQRQGNIAYYQDFNFKGSKLGIENVYIVEIINEKQRQTANNKEKNEKKEYQIYDENQELIATVSTDGKVQFATKYLEELKVNFPEYFKTLELENIEFTLPERQKEKDLEMSRRRNK